MSTFKRLFNVGKGKAKVARKGVADTDWVDAARHTAADAAEAVADAIRPPDRASVDPMAQQPEASAVQDHPAEDPVAHDDEPVIDDAEVVVDTTEHAPKTAKKRTL